MKPTFAINCLKLTNNIEEEEYGKVEFIFYIAYRSTWKRENSTEIQQYDTTTLFNS